MARRKMVSRGTRRKLVWARQAGSVTVATAAAPATAAPTRVDLLAPFVAELGAAPIGCTITRVRGIMGVDTITATTAQLTAVMYIGDGNDIARGPNANDNFYDDSSAHKDYFLVEPFLAPSTAATDLHLHGNDVVARIIDSKSSRKLEEVSQRLVLDISGNAVAVSTQVFFFDLSVLVMLP